MTRSIDEVTVYSDEQVIRVILQVVKRDAGKSAKKLVVAIKSDLPGLPEEQMKRCMRQLC